MSGAIEARELLSQMRTEELQSLTSGHKGGIYNGSPFTRNYVDHASHGVRFLTTSSMTEADVNILPLLSKKDALSNKLSFLKVEEGMSLITCSGSIGRMAFARADMTGTWSNQDILKVVADAEKISDGYLYAYLSSRFGVPLITSGTYGAIIQHIEPHHIGDLPVPRLGDIESKADRLIKRASTLRTEAINELKTASEEYLNAAGIGDISPEYWHENSRRIGFSTTVTKLSLRAMNYLPINKDLESRVKTTSTQWKELEQIVVAGTLRSGPRFKRIDSEPEFGVELIGQQECFNLRPSGRWIAKKYLPNDQLLFPPDGAVMIAAQGCAGEHDLFGRAQFITGKRLNYAYSQHFLRVIADENQMPRGALFAYLNSQIAYRIRKGYQIGSMQQDFHPDMIKKMPVPIIDRTEAERIDAAVRSAYKKFDDAIDAEDEAIALVERAIEEGGL
jgi:type I restriction enzyme S subunit